MHSTVEHRCDVLIIGSGAAGLSLALKLAEHCQIIVLSKSSLAEGSTRYAQGGIAAVFDEDDSIESHVKDTLDAGAGLCDEQAVHFTASRARSCMQWLIDFGMPFDQLTNAHDGEQKYHLTREGGHSHRRILHAADATGEAVQVTLIGAVKQHPNIHIFERYNAVDLIKSKSEPNQLLGAYVWNRKHEHVEVIRSKFTALATGGASKEIGRASCRERV